MSSNFIEGIHYYFDKNTSSKGAIVFTEKYHLNRGYCCGNGCRHCPYDPPYERGNKTITEKENSKNTD